MALHSVAILEKKNTMTTVAEVQLNISKLRKREREEKTGQHGGGGERNKETHSGDYIKRTAGAQPHAEVLLRDSNAGAAIWARTRRRTCSDGGACDAPTYVGTAQRLLLGRAHLNEALFSESPWRDEQVALGNVFAPERTAGNTRAEPLARPARGPSACPPTPTSSSRPHATLVAERYSFVHVERHVQSRGRSGSTIPRHCLSDPPSTALVNAAKARQREY